MYFLCKIEYLIVRSVCHKAVIFSYGQYCLFDAFRPDIKLSVQLYVCIFILVVNV